MTVPELTATLLLIYLLVYTLSIPLDTAIVAVATRSRVSVRIPGRKRTAHRVAEILGGQPDPLPYLILLERRRQSRRIANFIAAILLTLASFTPLASYVALYHGISVFGLAPNTTAPSTDLAKFFETMLTLPLCNVLLIIALKYVLRYGEPSDALLWNSIVRLLVNEEASRKTWRARAQARTRLLDQTAIRIRRDFSTLDMRDRRRRIDVDPSPLIYTWRPDDAGLPFAISPLDRLKVYEFTRFWAAGHWAPLMAQFEVSTARSVRVNARTQLRAAAYVAFLAAIPIGIIVVTKKLELSSELVTSIAGLASTPLLISILTAARRIFYNDPATGDAPPPHPPLDRQNDARDVVVDHVSNAPQTPR